MGDNDFLFLSNVSLCAVLAGCGHARTGPGRAAQAAGMTGKGKGEEGGRGEDGVWARERSECEMRNKLSKLFSHLFCNPNKGRG